MSTPCIYQFDVDYGEGLGRSPFVTLDEYRQLETEAERLREALLSIYPHLYTAHAQCSASDDAIIVGHVYSSLEIVKTAL